LAVVSVLTVAAWLSAPAIAGWVLPSGVRWLIGAATLASAVGAVRAALQQVAIDLNWDGQAWWRQGPGMPEPEPCRLQIVADLGGWMLLRCAPQHAGGWRAEGLHWLALQRRAGASMQWHALRCALYTSRPQG
jgi:hypothetical protein